MTLPDPMECGLTAIFDRQLALQRDSFGTDPLSFNTDEAVKFIDWNLTALVQEAAEARDEVAWKPWAKDRGQWLNRDNLVREMVDIMHFTVNVFLACGADADEVLARYLAKSQVNAKRQADGYTHTTNKGADGRALDEPEILRREPDAEA